MITPDGWLTWAERVRGPVDKCYSQPCASMGYVPHSAVGFYQGWLNRLFSTARRPDGRYTPYAAASVTGFIRFDGRVIQHYPLGVSCWASGNRHANTTFNAFENEGGYPDENEPLTEPQIGANCQIIEELAAWRQWEPRRPVGPADKYASLYEHHEAVELWGGDPTACPSARIPWDIFEEELDMLLREQVAIQQRELEALQGSQAFQNDMIVGLNGAQAFTSKVVVNHERRLVKLGSQPSDGR